MAVHRRTAGLSKTRARMTKAVKSVSRRSTVSKTASKFKSATKKMSRSSKPSAPVASRKGRRIAGRAKTRRGRR